MNKMSKIISRLSIFFIGIPFILFIVSLKFCNHIVLHSCIVASTVLAAIELYDMFAKKTKLLPKVEICILSAIIPIVAGLKGVLPCFIKLPDFFSGEIITYTLILSFIVLLISELFTKDSFDISINKLTASFFIVVYTGYLSSFISRMTMFTVNGKNAANEFLIIFLLMVFFCDSLAWFFGMTLGKNNRGFIKASPNKSIAGFAGGIFSSILAGVIAYFVFPEIFGQSLAQSMIIGFCISISAIVGDLIESVFKRSADVKDSGTIIPGRGGVLDSIDSVLVSAPVYFVLVSLLFKLY